MAPPGRKESSLWECFSKLHKPNNKGPWAFCKRCNKGLQGLLPRMKKHLEQCHSDFEPCEQSSDLDPFLMRSSPNKTQFLSKSICKQIKEGRKNAQNVYIFFEEKWYIPDINLDWILLRSRPGKTIELEARALLVKPLTQVQVSTLNFLRQLQDGTLSEDGLEYGCGALILNLLCKDLHTKSVTDKVLTVVKYFRNTLLPGSWLRNETQKKLQLPSDTRWNSMSDALQCYLEAGPPLFAIVDKHRLEMKSEIYSIICNLGHKRFVEEMLNI